MRPNYQSNSNLLNAFKGGLTSPYAIVMESNNDWHLGIQDNRRI